MRRNFLPQKLPLFRQTLWIVLATIHVLAIFRLKINMNEREKYQKVENIKLYIPPIEKKSFILVSNFYFLSDKTKNNIEKNFKNPFKCTLDAPQDEKKNCNL